VIWNPAAETAPAATRRAWQLDRLRATVAWVRERVPFYRARLAGLAVEDLADLARIPFTTKADLREQYPFGLLAVPLADIARLHASSGTKGKPTLVGYAREDLAIWRVVMARVMVAAGARPGDLLHNAFGYGLFTGGLGFHQGAEEIGLTVLPASSGNTARQCLLLRDLRPAGLAATPSFALHIAETLAEQGSRPAELGLRYGMFGAEPWTEAVRQALERGLGARAHDVYGLSEIIGPGVSGECEAREGLHVADDHFLPEVIDPATGERLPPGRQGELVLTTLTKRGMPLLRYRTGDVTTLIPDACRCGRTSARMTRLVGRSDDMLVIKGVNVYPSEVEGALLAVEDLLPHYQLVVDRTVALARLEIQVEPSPGFLARAGSGEASHPAVAALRERVAGRLRAALGLTVDVTLVPPRTIARSEGKAVRVIERA
jgi:phenylacetate-CoA ligase